MKNQKTKQKNKQFTAKSEPESYSYLRAFFMRAFIFNRVMKIKILNRETQTHTHLPERADDLPQQFVEHYC